LEKEAAVGKTESLFFKFHKPSLKPKAIAFEVNHLAAWVAKKKASYSSAHKAGLSKPWTSSRLGKRKRKRSHTSLKKKVMPLHATGTTLTSQLLVGLKLYSQIYGKCPQVESYVVRMRLRVSAVPGHGISN
jgi:hypothetical protein